MQALKLNCEALRILDVQLSKFLSFFLLQSSHAVTTGLNEW